jgi:hypothetical protein
VIVITGSGRSGTSFAAEAFKAAGIDPGGTYHPEWNAGWEYPPVREVNDIIRKQRPFIGCEDSIDIMPALGPMMIKASKDMEIVKDPRFSYTLDLWYHAGLIERVIHMIRLPHQVVESQKKRRGVQDNMDWSLEQINARIGYVEWVCTMHRIPSTRIRFPSVALEEADDFHKLVTEVGSLCGGDKKAMNAIRSVRDVKKVHEGAPQEKGSAPL